MKAELALNRLTAPQRDSPVEVRPTVRLTANRGGKRCFGCDSVLTPHFEAPSKRSLTTIPHNDSTRHPEVRIVFDV